MMKRLIVVVLVLVLGVAGIGFYRSWFTVSTHSPNTGTNKVNVNLTMDPDKVKADAEAVKEKAVELAGQATDNSKDPAVQATGKEQATDKEISSEK
jgi:flagellar basal body-associated protein FliL